MTSYSDFSVLRLEHFVPKNKIRQLRDWEILGRVWVGEALGFSEWLRLVESHDALGSLSLDLSELDLPIFDNVLKAIGLPLAKGMSLSQIEHALGLLC